LISNKNSSYDLGSSGSITFDLPQNVQRLLTFTVEGRGPAGDTVKIERTFRISKFTS